MEREFAFLTQPTRRLRHSIGVGLSRDRQPVAVLENERAHVVNLRRLHSQDPEYALEYACSRRSMSTTFSRVAAFVR